METFEVIIPVVTPTPSKIRGDWREVIELSMDSPTRKEVRVIIPGTIALPEVKARAEIIAVPEVAEDLNVNPPIFGKTAVVGHPAVAYRAAVPATVTLPLVVWFGEDYEKMQNLNDGGGWLQPDLIKAVENLLKKMASK